MFTIILLVVLYLMDECLVILFITSSQITSLATSMKSNFDYY